MKNPRGLWLAWLLLCIAVSGTPAWAQDQAQDQAQQLRILRDTTIALLNELVQQGVLTREKADELIRKAEEAGQGGTHPPTPGPAAAAAAGGAGSGAPGTAAGVTADAGGTAAAPAPGVIRVPYIPETVKQEIKEQVRQDVVAQARKERWGEPGALPDWLSRITWSGDVRLRLQGERFPTDAVPNATPQELALPQNGAYTLTNTSDAVNIMRIRARFGMDATISDSVNAGIRLASGGVGIGTNGASESQTLGNYAARESVGFDLAYLSYHPGTWFSLTGGRLGDPFFHPTTLVWSNDLSLEGVVMSLAPHLTRNLGVFATAGLFPIQDIEPSPANSGPAKWLYGYQTGLNLQFARDSALHFAVAYYDYRAVEGILNPTPFVTFYSSTAAPFRQNGNSVFDIDELANTLNGTQNYLIGLVSKFHELNGSATLDLGFGGRTHVILDLDYVKNLGFNATDILERTGLTLTERTKGAQADLKVGDADFARTWNWQGFLAYRYAQRDSVIDAFTDADFNFGGTNAQGYILGGELAFAPNTTLRGRWFSSKQIDGLPLAINLLMIDATTRF